jgi:hypothetical protein
MKRGDFVAEGKLEVGPKEEFFTFLGGDHLGTLLVRHFEGATELGYTDLGRVRITVERLEEPRR